MAHIRVAFFAQDTGQVESVFEGPEELLVGAGWVEIADGIEIDDPRDWVVDLSDSSLVSVGHMIPMDEIKAHCKAELSDTDWTQLSDTPLPTYKQIEFRTYRSALRQMMASYTPVQNPPFPVRPSEDD